MCYLALSQHPLPWNKNGPPARVDWLANQILRFSRHPAPWPCEELQKVKTRWDTKHSYKRVGTCWGRRLTWSCPWCCAGGGQWWGQCSGKTACGWWFESGRPSPGQRRPWPRPGSECETSSAKLGRDTTAVSAQHCGESETLFKTNMVAQERRNHQYITRQFSLSRLFVLVFKAVSSFVSKKIQNILNKKSSLWTLYTQ